MGLFGKTKAEKEAEEAAAKAAAEEKQRKIAAQEAEKKRVIEETRKAMDERKTKADERKTQAGDGSEEDGSFVDERKSRVEEQHKKNSLGKSHVKRAGVKSAESDAINEQIRLKMEKIKEKEAQKKAEAEAAKEKANQERIARGEAPLTPTVGQQKWGALAAGGGGGGGLLGRLKAMQAEQAAAEAASRAGVAAEEVDPLKAGINRPLPKPGHTVTLQEKAAARSAAGVACGLFLTYEDKVALDEKVNKLNRKIKDLEEKCDKLQRRLDGEKEPTVAANLVSKVRRMSAAFTGAPPSPPTRAKAGDVDALTAYAQSLDSANPDLPPPPSTGKKSKMRRLSAAIFGGATPAPGVQPALPVVNTPDKMPQGPPPGQPEEATV